MVTNKKGWHKITLMLVAKNILHFRENFFYIYEKTFFIKVSQSVKVQQ